MQWPAILADGTYTLLLLFWSHAFPAEKTSEKKPPAGNGEIRLGSKYHFVFLYGAAVASDVF